MKRKLSAVEAGAGAPVAPKKIKSEAAANAEELDVQMKGASLMLVKIPGYLLDEWEKKRHAAGGGAANLGKLIIDSSKRVKGKPAMRMLCEGMAEELPQKYDLRQSQEFAKVPELNKPGMLILSENATQAEGENKFPKVEGHVGALFDVSTDTRDPKYKALMKNKFAQIELDRVGRMQQDRGQRGGMGFIPPVLSTSKAKPEPKADMNVRRPRLEVENELFKLFQEQTYWKTKDLKDKVKQPMQWLQEILEGMCVKGDKGEHRNQWCLKTYD